MLCVLAALVLIPVDAPLQDSTQLRTVRAPEGLHKLTVTKAAWRQGQPVTLQVIIDSRPMEHKGHTLYDAAGFGADGIHRTVWFKGEPAIDPEKPVVVQGRLLVIWHATTVIQGERFPGFWELRMVDAERRS